MEATSRHDAGQVGDKVELRQRQGRALTGVSVRKLRKGGSLPSCVRGMGSMREDTLVEVLAL